MRYVSLFSGIEAATVAWEPLGWEPMCFAEFDAFPSAVLQEHFPNVPNLGDVTKINWQEFKEQHGRPDLVVGGSPCQSFSTAGKREGLDGASGLMWEYVRAVRELMPRWFVWENVKGALSSTHGEDFRCLLESMDDLGYGMAWRVLDAQFFGVPQRRERVFLVGCLGDPEGPAQVLFEREGLPRNFVQGREKRAQLAADSRKRAKGADCYAIEDGASHGSGNGLGINWDGSAYTLTANDRHSVDFCPEASEQTRSAGETDELSPTLTSSHPRAVGTVCMASTQGGAAVNDELCGTLMATADRCTPLIASANLMSSGLPQSIRTVDANTEAAFPTLDCKTGQPGGAGSL